MIRLENGKRFDLILKSLITGFHTKTTQAKLANYLGKNIYDLNNDLSEIAMHASKLIQFASSVNPYDEFDLEITFNRFEIESFLNQGGFTKIAEDALKADAEAASYQEFLKGKERVEYDAAHSTYEFNRLQIQDYKRTRFIAWAGLVVAILAFIIPLLKTCSS